MADNKKTIATLNNLLDYDAGKLTNAEIQLKNSLSEWINKASSIQLKTVLQKYLGFVHMHLQKMEEFFEAEKMFYPGYTNRVMKAFIDEAEERLSSCTDMEITDACLLASIQSINHFKISTYGTAAAFANVLGLEKKAAVFHEAEINEKQIDDRLSQLAEHEINIKAKTPIALPR
jgi:ferritin-like metal-binding protein YciE